MQYRVYTYCCHMKSSQKLPSQHFKHGSGGCKMIKKLTVIKFNNLDSIAVALALHDDHKINTYLQILRNCAQYTPTYMHTPSFLQNIFVVRQAERQKTNCEHLMACTRIPNTAICYIFIYLCMCVWHLVYNRAGKCG